MTNICPTCKQPAKLSDPQRDRYFAMIGNLLQHPKLQHLTRTQLDMYFRDKFLGGVEITLPSGKVIYQVHSLSRKAGPNVPSMSEFIDQCQAWIAEVGVWEVER